jgi:hypothetical protein
MLFCLVNIVVDSIQPCARIKLTAAHMQACICVTFLLQRRCRKCTSSFQDLCFKFMLPLIQGGGVCECLF